MSKREEFHEILVSILGSRNVYFQPPSTVKMKYPCIVYGRNNIETQYGDDLIYKSMQGYIVTIIDSNPDSLIPNKVAQLNYSRFDRHFTADNLNHDTYTIYY